MFGEDAFGPGTGLIWLDNVKCSGEESHILSCPQLPLKTDHDCDHSEDVGVRCFAGILIVALNISSLKNSSFSLNIIELVDSVSRYGPDVT